MNSTLEILNPPTEIREPAPEASQSSDAGMAGPARTTPDSEHRGRGKIACLPKKVRDQLNHMLEDGVRYAQIKEKLGEHGKDLTPDNISQWKKRGHQAWLKEQFWREEMRARMDAFTDLLGDTDPAQLPMVGLQMSLTQLCEQLRDLGPGARKDQFEADADKYLRMLNTLSRLSKSFLALQKFQRDSAATAAVELKRLDPNRKINIVEETAMHDRADDFFGWKSAARIKREMVEAGSGPALRDEVAPSEVLQPSGLKEGSRGSQSPETPGSVPPNSLHPAGMPEPPNRTQSPARSTPPAPPSDAAGLAAPKSNEGASASTPVFPLACGFCPDGPTRLGANFKHCCKDSASELSPPAPSSTLAPCASTPEECYYCRKELPPLLPNGQRPFTHCEKCGTALRPPETRHLYCPKCHGRLHNIFDGDHRTSDLCPHCAAVLPPPPTREPTPAAPSSTLSNTLSNTLSPAPDSTPALAA